MRPSYTGSRPGSSTGSRPGSAWGADPLPSSPKSTGRPVLFENAFPKPSGTLFADDSNNPVKGPLRASQVTMNGPNGRLSSLNWRQPADEGPTFITKTVPNNRLSPLNMRQPTNEGSNTPSGTANAPKSRSPLNSPLSRQPADVDLPADWGMPRCPPNFGASEKAALSRPAGLAFRQQDNTDNGQISFSSKRQHDIAD